MTMNHARALDVISRNCSQNATTAKYLLPTNLQGSWFTRFIQKIPGGSWLKNKLGRIIHGPTYSMEPSELKAYILSQKRALQLGYLRQEKEAQFKVAKFLALQHPDFYWSKYIDKLDKGSEERKRGFFLFVLTNKEHYGQYYGRYSRHIGLVNKELIDMGLKAATMNIVKDIVPEKDMEIKTEKKRSKRDIQSVLESLSGNERKLFTEMDKVVNGLDISSLERKLRVLPSENGVMKRSPKARTYQKRKENVL